MQCSRNTHLDSGGMGTELKGGDPPPRSHCHCSGVQEAVKEGEKRRAVVRGVFQKLETLSYFVPFSAHIEHSFQCRALLL